jgi:hypothetical protein
MFQPGVVLQVGPEAGPHFVEAFAFRVVALVDWPAFDGWAWVEGDQLDSAGRVVERNRIFVLLSGLREVERR